jgi:2-polyprenyl-3-methyl-5-hydroxy-6-metoxy-1,4-benzoquinol methylase
VVGHPRHDGDARQAAKRILNATGIQGGQIVHLGCGGGQLTAALRTSDNIVVQGLDTSPANIEKARAAIQSSGLYGPVSVNLFDGKRLPILNNG